MPYTTITTDAELKTYCDRLSGAREIAFDTEFVSERSYRPVLCLVQVMADGEAALIDPLSIADMTPFWEVIAGGSHETIVHAGRGEVEFCLHAVGRTPSRLFDVQLAAGFVGIEYPAGYGTLISRLLGVALNKHETRTDWRRRPLTPRQIQYALDDIHHLPALRDALHARLESLGRREWMDQETSHWLSDIQGVVSQERWRRVSGNASLSSRSLAILRELHAWREEQAKWRDCPVRRVLRDDLLVELAKRQTADPKRIQAVRGLERPDLTKQIPKIAEAIQRGLEIIADQCPATVRHESAPQLSVLGQFLFAALGSVCRQQQLAPGLVGTPNDVRDLIAFQTGQAHLSRPPRLAEGWRAGVVGQLFNELLAGKVAIRVADPASDSPLVLVRIRENE